MEPSTARALVLVIEIQGRAYTWTAEDGLDPDAALTVDRMVYGEARRLEGTARGQGLALEDLVQEGRIGALMACRRFNPDKGCRFSSYAHRWIHMMILRSLWHAEIVKPSEVHHRQLRLSGELPQFLSLQGPAGPNRTLEDTLRDESVNAADLEDLFSKLYDSLRQLDPQDQEVLMRRYGLAGQPDETLEAIGATYGVTRERARQIQVRAEQRLRQVLSRRGVKELGRA